MLSAFSPRCAFRFAQRSSFWRPLVMLAALAVNAQAALESFSYADGTAIPNQGGGTGWSGLWSTQTGNGSILAQNGSLVYPGIVSTGGKMVFTGIPATGTSTSTLRVLDTPLTEGSITYLSYLAQNTNEGRRFFGLAMFDGNTERALLGQGSSFANWTLNHVEGFPATANILDSGVDSSSVSLLVLKLELLFGVERVTFWVNPNLSLPENAGTAIGGSSFLTDIDYVQVTRLRLGGGGFNATTGDPTNHLLDEIRIDSASPFAVPEPATAGLFVGGLALLGAGRRRGGRRVD